MTISLLLVVYVILFIVVTWTCLKIRSGRKRKPWPQGFKLRRGPGEGLLNKVMELDDKLPEQLFLAVAIPPVLAAFPLVLVPAVPQSMRWAPYLGAAVLIVVFLFFRVRSLLALASERSNLWLGYYGERAVAQSLEELRGQGYQVFHDVPASRGDVKFNLDHVTVGRTGIVVVETKARRKPEDRPGENHKVTFDGVRLIWPWGEETRAIEQTTRNVQWLGGWLKERTGMDLPIRGIVALPGWYVTEKGKGAVRVQNPAGLPKAVTGFGKEEMSAQQVDLVSRQLHSICADVEP